MNFDEQTIAEFERDGPEAVRLKVQAGSIGPRRIQLALDWLRDKDAAQRIQLNQTEKARKNSERIRLMIEIAILTAGRHRYGIGGNIPLFRRISKYSSLEI